MKIEVGIHYTDGTEEVVEVFSNKEAADNYFIELSSSYDGEVFYREY